MCGATNSGAHSDRIQQWYSNCIDVCIRIWCVLHGVWKCAAAATSTTQGRSREKRERKKYESQNDKPAAKKITKITRTHRTIPEIYVGVRLCFIWLRTKYQMRSSSVQKRGRIDDDRKNNIKFEWVCRVTARDCMSAAESGTGWVGPATDMHIDISFILIIITLQYIQMNSRAHTHCVCAFFFFIHSFFSFVPCRLPAHAGDGGMHVCVRMWLYIKLWVQLISRRTTNRERKKNWWTIAQVLYIYSIIYILYVCVCLCELSHQCAINSACVCVCVQCIIIIV